MKNNSFKNGMLKLFNSNIRSADDVIKKYPSNVEKNPEKILKSAWELVGNIMKESIDKYGNKNEK